MLKTLTLLTRQTSTIDEKGLIEYANKWANDREESDSENMYYVDVFDSRNNKSYKVFSDKAKDTYKITNEMFGIDGVIYLSDVVDEVNTLKELIDNFEVPESSETISRKRISLV